jgi:aminoglycoside/choline kinase family phosphotransferase
MTAQHAFLDAAGWREATATPLAADASARRYTRLALGATRAVLMEAPVATEADRASFAAFRRIGAHLRGLGLSAPEEFRADPAAGLILMEDLGDTTLSRLLADDPTTARQAYAATAALLPRLARTPPVGLAAPNADGMAAMVGLTFDLLPDSDALRARLLAALAEALRRHAPGAPVLSLRDVHGDNLLWLPHRAGDARIGLLDFQDALLLPSGYDLASLLDDPRRNVPEDWRNDLISEFADTPRINVLSLQRNLRILGIFHRLATQFGKPQYHAFLPRTRALVARAAEGLPVKAEVADLLDRTAGWGAA